MKQVTNSANSGQDRTPDPAKYRHPSGWDIDLPPLTLTDMFFASAAAVPETTLVDFLGRKFSYDNLAQDARAFAAALQARGIGKGDRVGLFLPNVPLYISTYYGAMLAGATVVNFSPLYTADELGAQVRDSGTRLLVTIDAEAVLPRALEVLDATALEAVIVGRLDAMMPPGMSLLYRLFRRKDRAHVPAREDVLTYEAMLEGAGEPVPVPLDAADDIALLQYTGGTTGTPKGAILTHQNLSANARQVNACDPRRGERDVIMGVLPLFHVFANTCVLNRTVANRGTIVMLPRFDAHDTWKAIERCQVTAMPGVPTMYQALLDNPAMERADKASLRACISGGAPLPAPLRSRFQGEAGARLVEGYGLTESGGVVSTNPYEAEGLEGSIGQPLPRTLWKVVREDGEDIPAGSDDSGELLVKGPQIMRGYWNRPDADAEVFVDGWLKTGDVARIDENGFAVIVDRIKDMIAVAGFKVFPSEVEKVLLTHPDIVEAVVIGVPDAYRGECPKAFVTLAEDASEDGETLRDWVNGKLGKHERVQAVEVRAELPKTMIGKPDRKALRAEEAEEG